MKNSLCIEIKTKIQRKMEDKHYGCNRHKRRNNHGKKFDLVGDKDSASTTKRLSVEEIEAICSYFNTFYMYCENDTIERLKRLREKLAYIRAFHIWDIFI